MNADMDRFRQTLEDGVEAEIEAHGETLARSIVATLWNDMDDERGRLLERVTELEGMFDKAITGFNAQSLRVTELETAPLYLAEYDGMAPELHRDIKGAKEFVIDGASADMWSIPGRAWDFIEGEGGVLQMAWTDPDTDAPLTEGPGRVTPMRVQGAGNTAPDAPEPSPLCDCYSAENPALPHDPKCSTSGGGE